MSKKERLVAAIENGDRPYPCRQNISGSISSETPRTGFASHHRSELSFQEAW